MFFTKFFCFFFISFCFFSCKGLEDDLNPSNEDKRSSSDEQVGLLSSNFTVKSEKGEEVELFEVLKQKEAVVLYFTMWCPVCNSHTIDIKNNLKSKYPNVEFYLVDYISGSVSDGLSNISTSGFRNSFTALIDLENTIENLFDGNMSSTIIIKANKEIGMNEYYKRNRIEDILQNL